MKKIFKNLIVFLILQFNISGCFAYVLNSDELNNILISKLTNEAIQKLSINQKDCKIKINISNFPENIATNENSVPKIFINPISLIQPSSYRRVTIKNSNNVIIKTFGINVETKVYKNVLIAKKQIAYNEEINSTNTEIKEVEALKYLKNSFNTFQNDIISKRNYQKGDIITSDFAKSKPVVLKNSIVDIVFQSNGIKIKLQGHALKEGNIGDTILVRSDKYNKVYSAKISSTNEVVVKI